MSPIRAAVPGAFRPSRATGSAVSRGHVEDASPVSADGMTGNPVLRPVPPTAPVAPASKLAHRPFLLPVGPGSPTCSYGAAAHSMSTSLAPAPAVLHKQAKTLLMSPKASFLSPQQGSTAPLDSRAYPQRRQLSRRLNAPEHLSDSFEGLRLDERRVLGQEQIE